MRWIRRAFISLLVLAVALAAFGLYLARRSFPVIDGTITLAGIESPVEIVRDSAGVPHIFAESTDDLFFAQGYVHASDRFWQMDFWRHIGSARLSELFGTSQLETDTFLRALGFEAIAAAEYAAMSADMRSILDSYARGVNAYLADHTGSRLSFEYVILGLQNSAYEPEPWHPVHTLTWAKVMAWDLRSNLDEEIDRAMLAGLLATEKVESLYPPYPNRHPLIVAEEAAAPETSVREGLVAELATTLARLQRRVEAIETPVGNRVEDIGSNNWVVSGSRAQSGLPLLANDPHLGIQMPSIWYQAALHCESCDYHVAGFTFPGAPGVVIGHNQHIAWGLTTLGPDTMDLYVERVNPENRFQYEIDGEWVNMEVRTETISVAGTDPVEIEIRSTRHGPIISDSFGAVEDFADSGVELPEQFVIALQWRALQPSTLFESLMGINRAANYTEFREAASEFDIAAQNLVYADVEGNIAYQATGAIPIRATGDGRYPVPGWTSEHEWIGFIPFDDLPRALNPESGIIVTANQPPAGSSYPGFIGADHSYGYRAARITELLELTNRHSVESMAAIQTDNRDGGAPDVVPSLLAVETGDANVAFLQEQLDRWSRGSGAYQMSPESTGAAVYAAVWRNLLSRLFDELPEEQAPAGGSRWFEVVRILLEDAENEWWDLTATIEVETRDMVIATALTDAYAELRQALGPDHSRWEWGRLHTAEFANQSFGRSGIGPIEWMFNRTAPSRVGGGSAIVNATGWLAHEGYQVDFLPSMRMVVDLSDFDSSIAIHTTGQSGHTYHRHYDDYIEMWTDGQSHPMLWSRQAVLGDAAGILVLEPAAGS